jgi:hypothetical protein
MSRTDKDAPWWVQTDWYLPMHEMCQAGPYARYRWQTSQRGARECDLPETPVRKAKSYRRRSIWRLTEEQMHCYWEPEWPWEQRRYSFTWGPRREDRRLAWWGPDRRRVRDECRAARKEYRGFGDVETDVSKLHHNHAPRKGYWD